MQPPLVDCSELLTNPIATGIQRVVRGMLREWARLEVPHQVVRFVPGKGLCRVSEAAIDLLLAERSGQAGQATWLARQLAESSAPEEVVESRGRIVMVPEVFYDGTRCAFLEQLVAEHAITLKMIAYDFMPWLFPAMIKVISTNQLMPYLRLLTRADSVAFISAQTKRDFTDRVMRGALREGQAGPVMPLGADGLASPRQTWRPDRDGFLCVGSIERRKNQHVIAEAFKQLWSDGIAAPLILCGAAPDPTAAVELERYRGLPQFTWWRDAPDDMVAAKLHDVRATLFMSEGEGFGLPPVESLHAGVPVIVHDHVPSVDGIQNGLLRVEHATVDSIVDAVRVLLDDTVAERLWTEAAALTLPTWSDFARATASWILDGYVPTPAPREAEATPAADGPQPPPEQPAGPRRTARSSPSRRKRRTTT